MEQERQKYVLNHYLKKKMWDMGCGLWDWYHGTDAGQLIRGEV